MNTRTTFDASAVCQHRQRRDMLDRLGDGSPPTLRVPLSAGPRDQYRDCWRRISVTKYLSLRMKKPSICVRETKDADQLCSNCTADQRLCFRYSDRLSTIPLLLKSEISSF